MKLNKESQATLTALAKLLKELGNKDLGKQLTALRADIKALEAAAAEFATASSVEVSGETPVVPLTPPAPEPVNPDDVAQPQFDRSGQPILTSNVDTNGTITGVGVTSEVGSGQVIPEGYTAVTDDKGNPAGLRFTGLTSNTNGEVKAPEHSDANGAKGYELAFYVSPVQVGGASQFIGRRDKPEGNFTMPVYKEV